MATQLPHNYCKHPYDSVARKMETEIVARNIMAILRRTGNTWRRLTWEEYEEERRKDGNFSWKEKKYFKQVEHIDNAVAADKFCRYWHNPDAEAPR